jgi:hypothetical protein
MRVFSAQRILAAIACSWAYLLWTGYQFCRDTFSQVSVCAIARGDYTDSQTKLRGPVWPPVEPAAAREPSPPRGQGPG